MSHELPRVVSSLPLLLLLAACGGGGGGGAQRVADVTPPEVTMASGQHVAATDLDRFVVRGTASDASGVVDLSVNGVAAASADGFASWQASVALARGDNALAVDATDRAGRVRRGGVDGALRAIGRCRVEPVDVDFDAVHDEVIVLDRELNALLAISLGDGATRTITDRFGPGGPFERATAVAVAGDLGLAYVAPGSDRILEVDLVKGERKELSGPNRGAGPPLGFVTDVALDLKRKRLLAVPTDRPVVLAIDLRSGDRSIVSDATHGTGELFSFGVGLSLDAKDDLILLVDQHALFGVDPGSGDRKELSGPSSGSGPDLVEPVDVAWVPGTNHAWVVSTFERALFDVDLGDGDRVVFSDGSSAGPPARDPQRIAVAPDGSFGVLVDGFLSDLLAVAASDGRREFLDPEQFVGAGTRLDQLQVLALDPQRNRLFVGQNRSDPTTFESEILAIDLATGDRSLVANSTRGQGELLNLMFALAFDAAHDRVLLLKSFFFDPELLAIDPSTGDRTLVSGSGRGSGLPIESSSQFALDAAGEHAFMSARQSSDLTPTVVSVDLASGDRTELSGPRRGAGPTIVNIRAIAADPARPRLLVLTFTLELFAVDLASGDRELVVDFSADPILPLMAIAGFALDADGRVARLVALLDHDPAAFFSDIEPVILACDLESGATALVSSIHSQGRPLGPGGLFFNGSAFDAARGELFVLESETHAVLSADVVTGERAIVSR